MMSTCIKKVWIAVQVLRMLAMVKGQGFTTPTVASLTISIDVSDPTNGGTPQTVELSFDSSERRIEVAPGLMYTFTCTPSGGLSDDSPIWFRDSVAVSRNRSQRVYAMAPNNNFWNLVFTGFSSMDVGRYSCSYSGEMLTLNIGTANPAVISSTPSLIFISGIQGSNRPSLRPFVSGNPFPETSQGTWLFNGGMMYPPSSGPFSFSRDFLLNPTLSTQHTGTYSYTVVTREGTATVNFTVIVITLTITGNRVYQLGETSVINCSTQAEVPVQSIQWLDESSVVVRQGTSVQELVLDLTIAASHNNSRYTCRVSQETFMESRMINITTGPPPMVSLSDSGGPQIAGEDYTLTCQVTGGGITTPTYRWFRDGSLLTGQRSATLSFSPLRETDSGVYICEGTKNLVTQLSEGITIDPTTPRLPGSVREISVTSSSGTIQWMLTDPYNPSQPETFIVFYGVTSGQLNMSTPGVSANPTSQTYSTQLNSLQPGTEYFYRIESRNGLSSVFTDILSFMSMDRSSSGVTGLERRTVNDTTLVISWEPPANGRILSYSVSIINLSDGSILRQENTVSISVIQADLVPGVPYNVSIAAVNSAGPGEFSVFIHFTRELVPSISPKNVTVTRPSATVMVVSWIPLSYSEARGFISHYTIAYFPSSPMRKRQALEMTQTVSGNDANTTRIEGLDANTDYIVQVSATNGAGTSTPSTPLHVAAGTRASAGSGVPDVVVGVVVVVIIALLVVTALTTVIIVLALKLRRGTNSQPAQVDPSTYDDGKEEVYYSTVKAPPTNTGEGKGFSLSKCPAYGTPVPRGGNQPAVVQATSNI